MVCKHIPLGHVLVHRLHSTARPALALCAVINFVVLGNVSALAQTVKLNPSCGAPGTKVCVTGSGWAEPSPVCRYTFAFDGATIAPNQPDGLFGPPKASFTVPMSAAAGNHNVRVQLRVNFPDSLLQEKTTPFKVMAAGGTGDSATTSGAGGAGITLTYTPANPSCDSTCKSIVWVQVVQRFARKQGDTDAQALITTATDWPGFPDGVKKSIDETQDAKRVRVDRIWGRTFPYYGVDNSGVPAAGSANAGGTITIGKNGAPPTASTMYDAPNTPASFFPTRINSVNVTIDKAILKFESAPFCADGDQVGRFVGKVVKWEFHQLAGKAGSVANVSVASGPPSGPFNSALSRWVSGNPPGTGTNRPKFDLPAPQPACL